MAYDEKLDDRIRTITAEWDLTRKKMFGGTGYLLNGNMMAGRAPRSSRCAAQSGGW